MVFYLAIIAGELFMVIALLWVLCSHTSDIRAEAWKIRQDLFHPESWAKKISTEARK